MYRNRAGEELTLISVSVYQPSMMKNEGPMELTDTRLQHRPRVHGTPGAVQCSDPVKEHRTVEAYNELKVPVEIKGLLAQGERQW